MAKDYLAAYKVEEGDKLDHGVKGMKWGIRKDRGHEGEQVKAKKLSKLDKKWERKNTTGLSAWINVNNTIAEEVNSKAEILNNNPKYKDKNLYQDKKLHDQYWNEVDKLLDASYAAASEKLGMNPSGTKKVVINREGFGPTSTWVFKLEDVKHSVFDDSYNAVVTPVVDANGHLIDLKFQDPSEIEHSEILHYGVKGMKWGIRKDRSSSSSASARAKEFMDKYRPKQGDWITEATKSVLKRAAKKGMQTVVDAAVREYITSPIVATIASKSMKAVLADRDKS